MSRPICLVVLDGFGIGVGATDPGDATAHADAPFFEHAYSGHAHAKLETSGLAVGLPEGQMGNSEVGHMTLGAGRIIDHDLIRVQKALDDGSLAGNACSWSCSRTPRSAGGKLHLMGLVSNGGVHSSLEHLRRPARALRRSGCDPDSARLHRRAGHPAAERARVDPTARRAPAWARRLHRDASAAATTRWTATSAGTALHAPTAMLVNREGEAAASAEEAIEKSYAKGEGDEFVQPTAILNGPPVADGDTVLHFNFRADRARELTNALTRTCPEKLGAEITALDAVVPGLFGCLTVYDEEFDLPAVFGPVDVREGLGELISRAGIKQLRIAETEKYAHVTYFFNGGIEEPFPGEDRILIPSPRDVATYDLKPEMSAGELTDRLIEALEVEDYGFILVNYANPDMVGHTGVLPAGIQAVEVVGQCLSRLCAAVQNAGVSCW